MSIISVFGKQSKGGFNHSAASTGSVGDSAVQGRPGRRQRRVVEQLLLIDKRRNCEEAAKLHGFAEMELATSMALFHVQTSSITCIFT